MRDGLGRVIDYARVSVTDRCPLRCVYCMPAGGVGKRRHDEILSHEDILRVCGAFAALGIRKIKITGGEPLARRGTTELVRRVRRTPGIECVTMTTNGQLFREAAEPLREAGLDGVNISLDATDPDRYRELTRGGDVRRVLGSVEAALRAGFPSVKINCVPLAGGDAADFVRIARMARELPVHVRFIELMPMGSGSLFRPYGRAALREALERAFGPLEPAGERPGNGPARYCSAPGFRGLIGFVETLDHALCGACNRVRLTADGVLKTCLHRDRGRSLKPALADADGGALARVIAEAIAEKPAHHEFARREAPARERRHMSEIGG